MHYTLHYIDVVARRRLRASKAQIVEMTRAAYQKRAGRGRGRGGLYIYTTYLSVLLYIYRRLISYMRIYTNTIIISCIHILIYYYYHTEVEGSILAWSINNNDFDEHDR